MSTSRSPLREDSPPTRRSDQPTTFHAVCIHPECPCKDHIRLEQLRCSRLVAANQILRETQQYLIDKCTSSAEEVNRMQLEMDLAIETAGKRELAMAVEREELREKIDACRATTIRCDALQQTNAELSTQLGAANQDKAVLVAQVTMLQSMLERLTAAHENIVALHIRRESSQPASVAAASPSPPPLPDASPDRHPSVVPAADDDDASPAVGSIAAASIQPMKEAIAELHRLEQSNDGLHLLTAVISEDKKKSSYYDSFGAIERVSETATAPSADPTSSQQQQAARPVELHSPAATALARMMEKDKARAGRPATVELLPQHHQPCMVVPQMGNTPKPPPNPQVPLTRSSSNIQTSCPDVGNGSPNRLDSSPDNALGMSPREIEF